MKCRLTRPFQTFSRPFHTVEDLFSRPEIRWYDDVSGCKKEMNDDNDNNVNYEDDDEDNVNDDSMYPNGDIGLFKLLKVPRYT